MLEPSVDQKKALDTLLDWYKGSSSSPNMGQFITVGGYAGTGKTTLIAMLRQKLVKDRKDKKAKPIKIAFCSYTGKATQILKQKLKELKVTTESDSVSTIHSLIYSPVVNSSGEVTGWEVKTKLFVDLIIVDEASMVDERIWKDLMMFGIPIIAVGDHGQLPPINGKFNLMDNPEVRLEKIHRQAEGNPIIQLSIHARESGTIPVGDYGAGVRKLSRGDSDSREIIDDLLVNYSSETMVLCGYNTTRIRLNKYVRSNRFESEFMVEGIPQVGDRVICLKNNHKKRIFNGMIGTLDTIAPHGDSLFYTEVSLDGTDQTYKGMMVSNQFNNSQKPDNPKGDLFDFGYALTVHKAQGSQSHRVLLFEERFKQMDDDTWRRWLYTGVTRAQEELIILEQR